MRERERVREREREREREGEREKSASNEPSSPTNYRPITLTSCIGKVYTTIIKDRWLAFMRSNKYFDTSIQKAFMPSVPGCIEHYMKLAAAINKAHSQHKSLGQCLRKRTSRPHQILPQPLPRSIQTCEQG